MSQYFEQALAAKLNAISALTAIVGTGIFTQAVPQTWDYGANGPALTYMIPTKPFGHVLKGSDGTATARVQFNAISYGYGISKQILESIRQSIDGQPGTWGDGTCVIMSVVQQDDIDLPGKPEDGSDKWIYEIISEYSVKYRVTIPNLV